MSRRPIHQDTIDKVHESTGTMAADIAAARAGAHEHLSSRTIAYEEEQNGPPTNP